MNVGWARSHRFKSCWNQLRRVQILSFKNWMEKLVIMMTTSKYSQKKKLKNHHFTSQDVSTFHLPWHYKFFRATTHTYSSCRLADGIFRFLSQLRNNDFRDHVEIQKDGLRRHNYNDWWILHITFLLCKYVYTPAWNSHYRRLRNHPICTTNCCCFSMWHNFSQKNTWMCVIFSIL